MKSIFYIHFRISAAVVLSRGGRRPRLKNSWGDAVPFGIHKSNDTFNIILQKVDQF